jgi:adenosylcobyric acid synthase (glutamine-hydrolyzing)
LNQIRIEKGLEPVTDQVMDLKEFKDLQYDKLAAVIRDSVDMKKIYQIMNGEEL